MKNKNRKKNSNMKGFEEQNDLNEISTNNRKIKKNTKAIIVLIKNEIIPDYRV